MGETNYTFTLGTLFEQDNLGSQISKDVELIYIELGYDAKVGGKFFGFEIDNSKKGKSIVVKFPFDATIFVISVYS